MSDLVVIGYDDEGIPGRAAEEVARVADDLIIHPEPRTARSGPSLRPNAA